MDYVENLRRRISYPPLCYIGIENSNNKPVRGRRKRDRITMVQQLRKSITSLASFVFAGWQGGAFAQAPTSPLAIRPDAPDRYIVVPGDTLWGISQRFTDSPWRWPELWGMNQEEIRNPHLIYPGYVIVLDRARGRLTIGSTP